MASQNLRESPHGTFYASSSSPLSPYPPFGSRSIRCTFPPPVNCQITKTLLKKPTPIHTEGRCGAHRGYHVLRVVHRQSPWNWNCCKTARSDPRFRSGLGNGLQSHVLHLQHGHTCNVCSSVSLLGIGFGLNPLAMPQTLLLVQRPPLPQCFHSCFRCLSGFLSSALSVSLSAPPPTQSMARPYGTQSNCLTCSWTIHRPMPLDLEYVTR